MRMNGRVRKRERERERKREGEREQYAGLLHEACVEVIWCEYVWECEDVSVSSCLFECPFLINTLTI